MVSLSRIPSTDPATVLAMYQALVEQIPAVLYVNGPGVDAHTLYVSPQTREILGLGEQDWFDDIWSTCVHPEDAESVTRNYARFIAEESVGVDEYRFIRPDGHEIWVHDRVSIIRDDAGAPTLVQGIMLDVTATKQAEQVLADQARQLARIEEIGSRFSAALLAGSDLGGLLRILAEICGSAVAFEDPAHQLIAYADGPPGCPRVLATWDAHARTRHSAQDRSCLSAPVRVRSEEWGTLHVLAATRALDEVDEVALDRACAAAGLWLLSSQRSASLAEEARSEVLADIWQGPGLTGSDLLDRFRSLGVDLRDHELAVIAVDIAAVRRREGDWTNSALRRRVADTVTTAMRSALASARLAGLAGCVGDTCLLVLGLPRGKAERAGRERLARMIGSAVTDRYPQLAVAVGVSRPVPVEGLRRAIAEAYETALDGSSSTAGGGVFHAEDAGLRLLLAGLVSGPELSRFVEGELGALLAHDAESRVPLLETLRAYLAAGSHKAAAARTLHLERRSLYYRLERIESLLGRSLDDPASRLRLEVALQGLDVLSTRGHVG